MTEKKIKKMIRLKRNRLTNKEIGERIERSRGWVGQILRKHMEDYDKYKYNKLFNDEIEEMISLKKEEFSNAEIGQRFGKSTARVGQILREHMEDYDKYKLKKTSDDEIEKMIRLRKLKLSAKKIGDIINRSKTTVLNQLRNNMKNYEKYLPSYMREKRKRKRERGINKNITQEKVPPTLKEKNNLSHSEVCKFINCKPTQDYLKKYEEFFSQDLFNII